MASSPSPAPVVPPRPRPSTVSRRRRSGRAHASPPIRSASGSRPATPPRTGSCSGPGWLPSRWPRTGWAACRGGRCRSPGRSPPIPRWPPWSRPALPWRPRSWRTRCTRRSPACGPAATTGTGSGSVRTSARSATPGRRRRRAARRGRSRSRWRPARRSRPAGATPPLPRAMLSDDLDLVVHVGDYTYERRDDETLADFRTNHARHKLSPDLQAAHAAFPFVVTFDDHEIENNWADEISQPDNEPSNETSRFVRLRANAFQAYYEHLPLRLPQRPQGPDMLLQRRLDYGTLATFHVLDTRQYRSTSSPRRSPADPSTRASTTPRGPSWAMSRSVGSSPTWSGRRRGGTWSPSSTIMAQVDYDAGAGMSVNHDQWDGYAVSRNRFLSFVDHVPPHNPVVLSGDWHSAWVNDLRLDFGRPETPVLATELVGTSISSGCGWAAAVKAARPNNPHVKYLNPDCAATPGSSPPPRRCGPTIGWSPRPPTRPGWPPPTAAGWCESVGPAPYPRSGCTSRHPGGEWGLIPPARAAVSSRYAGQPALPAVNSAREAMVRLHTLMNLRQRRGEDGGSEEVVAVVPATRRPDAEAPRRPWGRRRSCGPAPRRRPGAAPPGGRREMKNGIGLVAGCPWLPGMGLSRTWGRRTATRPCSRRRGRRPPGRVAASGHGVRPRARPRWPRRSARIFAPPLRVRPPDRSSRGGRRRRCRRSGPSRPATGLPRSPGSG